MRREDHLKNRAENVRIEICTDEGEWKDITADADFEITVESVPGAAEDYQRLLDKIKPIKITTTFRPVYYWFGELFARVFSFSKN